MHAYMSNSSCRGAKVFCSNILSSPGGKTLGVLDVKKIKDLQDVILVRRFGWEELFHACFERYEKGKH